MTTPRPDIHLTERAISQIKLILENDYTLKGQSLRIHISGKECDGFTYSVGFQNPIENDLFVNDAGVEVVGGLSSGVDSPLPEWWAN